MCVWWFENWNVMPLICKGSNFFSLHHFMLLPWNNAVFSIGLFSLQNAHFQAMETDYSIVCLNSRGTRKAIRAVIQGGRKTGHSILLLVGNYKLFKWFEVKSPFSKLWLLLDLRAELSLRLTKYISKSNLYT